MPFIERVFSCPHDGDEVMVQHDIDTREVTAVYTYRDSPLVTGEDNEAMSGFKEVRWLMDTRNLLFRHADNPVKAHGYSSSERLPRKGTSNQ